MRTSGITNLDLATELGFAMGVPEVRVRKINDILGKEGLRPEGKPGRARPITLAELSSFFVAFATEHKPYAYGEHVRYWLSPQMKTEGSIVGFWSRYAPPAAPYPPLPTLEAHLHAIIAAYRVGMTRKLNIDLCFNLTYGNADLILAGDGDEARLKFSPHGEIPAMFSQHGVEHVAIVNQNLIWYPAELLDHAGVSR